MYHFEEYMANFVLILRTHISKGKLKLAIHVRQDRNVGENGLQFSCAQDATRFKRREEFLEGGGKPMEYQFQIP